MSPATCHHPAGFVPRSTVLKSTSRLAIIPNLARDNIERRSYPLVCADESVQKPYKTNDDAYDASEIDQEKQSADSCHDLWLHDLVWVWD